MSHLFGNTVTSISGTMTHLFSNTVTVHVSSCYFNRWYYDSLLFSNTVTVHVSNCYFNRWYYDSLVQQLCYRACQQLLPHPVVLPLTRSATLLPCMPATVTSLSGTLTHLFSSSVTVHANNCYFTQQYCDSLVQRLRRASQCMIAATALLSLVQQTQQQVHLTIASQDALFPLL